MPYTPKIIFVLAALIATSIFVFLDTYLRVLEQWLNVNSAFSHGFIAAAILVYFFYQYRSQFRFSKTINIPLISILFFSSLGWLLGWAADLQAVQTLALWAVLTLGAALLVEKSFRLQVIKLFGILAFAMPFWTVAVPLLQLIAAKAIKILFNLFDVSVVVEDVYVETEVGIFEIAGSCSGIGFIMVACTLGWALALLQNASWIRLIIMVAIAATIAIIANWIRIAVIIGVGLHFGIEHPMVRDHDFLGWVVFLSLMAWPVIYATNQPPNPNKHIPSINTDDNERLKHPNISGHGIMIALAAFLLPLLSFAMAGIQPKDTNFLKPSAAFTQIVDAIEEDWVAHIPSADEHLLYTTANITNRVVYLSMHRFENQAHDKELINNRNNLYPARWIKRQATPLIVHETVSIPIQYVSRDGQGMCMAQWYRVAGETKLNAFEVKVAAAVGRLQGRTDGEFIRLATPCSNPDEGLQVLREHIEALIKNS